MLLLTKELGESIEGTRELGHDQHCLEVVRDLKPRRIASGEVGCHLVDGDGGVLVVGDLDVHSRFELEVGSNDTVIVMTFQYVFWNGLTFFELFKLLFFTWIDHDPPCSHDLCLFLFLMFHSSHDHMAKRSHYCIMIFL